MNHQRNTSIQRYLEGLAQNHEPRLRFAGSDAAQWRAWRDELLPAVKATLGHPPEPVPLRAETIAEWREDGLIKRKFVFDVEAGLSATGYLFRPEAATGPRPAIVCCHGHGRFGKEAVMGNRASPELRAAITEHNYDYGLQMAQAGFVTLAIDWRGFGERDDRRKPHHQDLARGRDLCNLHQLRATLLGRTVLGMNIHDGMRAIDHLCEQDCVDPERIGVMGLSFGGTMATWLSLCDERIKAADIICYSDRFAAFGYRDANFCGSQVTPGLFELCDVPDLHGLIAPRPLLVEIGVHDACFRVEDALSCFREVERVYEAAGVRDRLALDLFEGGHRWGANQSVTFFEKWLGRPGST